LVDVVYIGDWVSVISDQLSVISFLSLFTELMFTVSSPQSRAFSIFTLFLPH
jgi:hypothetical protein